MNSPVDKMRTTGEQAFCISTYQVRSVMTKQLVLNDLSALRWSQQHEQVVCWPGGGGVRWALSLFFKIFQVPLTKGTKGLK